MEKIESVLSNNQFVSIIQDEVDNSAEHVDYVRSCVDQADEIFVYGV